MVTIKLMVSRESGELFLDGTEITWPWERRPSSRSDWPAAEKPGLLLKLFVRYKIWCIQESDEAFSIRGGRGSDAESLHYLLDNSRKYKHWTNEIFGRNPKLLNECGLKLLLEVRQRKIPGQKEAGYIATIIQKCDVRIFDGETELNTEGKLLDLLRELDGTPRADYGPPNGPLVPGDPSYIEREEDNIVVAALARGDSVVRIRGVRQVGKTSLLARIVDRTRKAGVRSVITDFRELSDEDLKSSKAFFLWLGSRIAEAFELDKHPDNVWNDRVTSNTNFKNYLEKQVLGTIRDSLLLVMEGVDRLFDCCFGSDVFSLFRFFNEARVYGTEPWKRLTLVLGHAKDPSLFVENLNKSPFNVGTEVCLGDFTDKEVDKLNAIRGYPLKNGKELKNFCRLVGGHPYLTNRGLYEMIQHYKVYATLNSRNLEKSAVPYEGLFKVHLNQMLDEIRKDPELLKAVRAILRGKPCPTSESFDRLRASGVMKGDSRSNAQFRCELYKIYISSHIL
jgi:hypothetical protein